jgi:RimJ/RimL family protein N-acetyltransferase
MIVIETNRLVLREIISSDFDDLYRMNSDPVIMKYVGDGSIRNREQMESEMRLLISYYVRKPILIGHQSY